MTQSGFAARCEARSRCQRAVLYQRLYSGSAICLIKERDHMRSTLKLQADQGRYIDIIYPSKGGFRAIVAHQCAPVR